MSSRRKKIEMPPKDHPTFVKHWDDYIDAIMDNPNYQPMHLRQLEILCDMHVEYERLDAVLDVLGGSTYDAEGRYGKQIKTRPEVTQMQQVRNTIAAYCRILGLGLTPRKASSKPNTPRSGNGETEWD